jgi:putative peptidoglycan lipid II flippase
MASIVVSATVSIGIAIPLRSLPMAAAGIALGSAMGSYVNLAILSSGLRQRLGALYTPAMWKGTRRIVVAALVAGVLGGFLRVAHQRWFPGLHPRIAGLPVLAGFGATYLAVAWALGSAEAARWLRLPVRPVRR